MFKGPVAHVICCELPTLGVLQSAGVRTYCETSLYLWRWAFHRHRSGSQQVPVFNPYMSHLIFPGRPSLNFKYRKGSHCFHCSLFPVALWGNKEHLEPKSAHGAKACTRIRKCMVGEEASHGERRAGFIFSLNSEERFSPAL